MTIQKSWLTTALTLLVSATLLTACGGKKSRAEKAAAKQASSSQAAPAEDITYPPTIVAPTEEAPE